MENTNEGAGTKNTIESTAAAAIIPETETSCTRLKRTRGEDVMIFNIQGLFMSTVDRVLSHGNHVP